MNARTIAVLGLLVLAGLAVASLPLNPTAPGRDTSEELLVRIAQDGTVELWQGPDEHTQVRLPFPAPGFDLEDEARSGRTIEALRTRLRERTEAAERANMGLSRLTMRIEAAPRTPMRFVTWIIIVGAEPGIMIGDYALSTRGRRESTTFTLPRDARPQIELDAIPMAMLIDVALVREGQMLQLTISSVDDIEVAGEVEGEGPLPWGTEGAQAVESMLDVEGTPQGLAAVVRELERRRAQAPGQPEVTVRINSPAPDLVLPARATIDLMGAINSVGDLSLELEGRLLPPIVPTGG